jgi:hypothetical protein
MSPWIEVVLVAEIAVAVLVRFLVRPALILRGMHYDRDQGQAVSPDWTGVPNSRTLSLGAHGGGSSDAILVHG